MPKKYDYETAVYVDPFPGKDDHEIVGEINCGRCGGTGRMPYRIDDGICYECKGIKSVVALTAGTARVRARNAVKAENVRRREAAKAKLAYSARVEAYAAVSPEWSRVDECEGSIILDLKSKARRFDLTDKQIAFGAKLIAEELQTREERLAKRAAELAAAEAMGPIAEGRREIRAKLVSVKSEVNEFSPYGGSTVKGLFIEETGHKVWGTVPAALLDLEVDLIGREVVLTATVKRSDKDQIFGFMSRPSKARLAE